MSTDPTGSIRSRARGVLVPVPTVVSCQGQGQGQGEGQGEGPREEGQSVGQRRGEQSFLERVLVGAITLGEVNVRGGGGIPYVRLTRYSILDTLDPTVDTDCHRGECCVRSECAGVVECACGAVPGTGDSGRGHACRGNRGARGSVVVSEWGAVGVVQLVCGWVAEGRRRKRRRRRRRGGCGEGCVVVVGDVEFPF